MYYIGKFPPNQAFCSPFRKDRHPSFIVGNKTGKWRHLDMANEYWCGGPIDLVRQIHNCSLQRALEIVDRDFKLGLSSGAVEKSKEVIKWETPKEEYHTPFIQVVTRKPTQEELRWWNQYYQDLDDLKNNEVYFPAKIFRNRKIVPAKASLLTFCYYEPITDKWKIYRPDGKSGKAPLNERKWDTNIKFDVIEQLHDIKNCNIAIIGKARKDSMVIRKALSITCTCTIQSENPYCFNQENIEWIKSNSKTQIITSDNDKTGISFSHWVTKTHKFRHCNVPYNIPNKQKPSFIKDFAEWGRDYGLEEIHKHFLDKGFLD